MARLISLVGFYRFSGSDVLPLVGIFWIMPDRLFCCFSGSRLDAYHIKDLDGFCGSSVFFGNS